VHFTHWILALIDSVAALLIRRRWYVMKFAKRRFHLRHCEAGRRTAL